MIVQACLNGARSSDFHPALPITADAIAAMVRPALLPVPPSCICPRAPDGHESLAPATMDVTVLAVRKACPGTLIGVSTGAWIEGNERRTLWGELPDYASVNLEEPDAPAVMERSRQRGVGIEAGLASVADAERLMALGVAQRVLRILIEVSEQDVGQALAVTTPTSPTGGIARGERVGIAEGRVQRSALQGVTVQAAFAAVAAVIFGGGCWGSSSFKRCSKSR